MVQGYYTLQEAAKILHMPLDELKQLAQKGKIRSFQDRGTLRFRIQDIQELARSRGTSGDDIVTLGDAPAAPKSGATPSPGSKKAQTAPKSAAKPQGDVFGFAISDDNVDLGADLLGGAKSKPPGSKGKKVPTPMPGSDSDVRLVADGSDVNFTFPKDSDIKLPVPDSDVKISPDPMKPRTGVHQPPPSSGIKRPSQLALGSGTQAKSKLGGSSAAKQSASPRPGSAPQPADSGVRLVPMDDDSDVKLHGSSDEVALGGGDTSATIDSNVRLDRIGLPPADSGEGTLHLTEEINLDEEILKQQERDKDQPSTRLKAKSELKFPTTSPFELSDSDLELPTELKSQAGPKTPRVAKNEGADSSEFDLPVQAPTEEGSSDFDLVPASDGSILLEGGDSNDFSLEASDDSEQVLDQNEVGELTSSSSGINLDHPADEGISLEDSSEGAGDFDLSLEVEDTPKPQKASPVGDSDSEFDLSLDSDSDAPPVQGESSEFELNLDGSGEVATTDSDSEFELTLDDSGTAALEEDDAKPQIKSKAKPKSKAKKPVSGEEQDIFDTDFDVPSLEESSDAAVADDLESSDFDLALDDSELAQEDESGSQVVALDEESVADGDGAVVDDVEVEDESSEFSDLDEDVQVEDEDAVDVEEETEVAGRRDTVTKEKLIPAAPWGVMPVIFMLPCVVIMLLVGILGYELVQTSAGLKPPGPLTQAIAEQIGAKVTLK